MFIAPAGTPLGYADLGDGLLLGAFDRSAYGRLESQLASRAAHRSCRLVSSGRAALTLILRALRAAEPDARRTEVIVPGYTCYSVPAAVVRAGLVPRICDVETRSLGIDPVRLRRFDFSRVLAIVATSLYGIPSELGELEAIAKTNGVRLVDDAAQALGATLAGRPVGGFGDTGLFSFDKGKNITTIQGGAILLSDDALKRALDDVLKAVPAARAIDTLGLAAKTTVYAAMLRPTCYAWVRRLPFLELGKTIYDTDYPIRRYGAGLARLASRLCGRLDEITRQRVRNAQAVAAAVRGLPGVDLAPGPAGATPVFARLPVLVDATARAALLAELERIGIGATRSYPRALADVPEVAARLPPGDLSATPVARTVARRIVTLPTHPFCPADMPARIATAFEHCRRVSQASAPNAQPR